MAEETISDAPIPALPSEVQAEADPAWSLEARTAFQWLYQALALTPGNRGEIAKYARVAVDAMIIVDAEK